MNLYRQSLLDKKVSCIEAVQYYLSQIESKKHLNAFLEVFSDEALARAKELDQQIAEGKSLGKLHGVVVGLKDVISYKNHRLSASSKILENYTAIYNATVVEKLLAEGAIIIGRQNCDEFAMGSSNENSAFGNVLNAADNARVPGGSSGGSAVAVQAGLCMVSLGSDTGGSVRQPADFCGVVGLKPSYGRVSRYGLIAYASSFDQIGIFSKTVQDAALVLEVIAGEDQYDSTVSNVPAETYSKKINEDKKYKIAYIKQTLEHPSLNKEIKEQIFAFIDRLKNDGHTVEPIDFEYLDYIVPTYYVLTTAEASTNLSRYDGVKFGYSSKIKSSNLTNFYKENRSQAFGKEVKKRIMLGTFVLSALYYDSYFTKAQQIRRIVSDKATEIFQKYDAIVSPNSPVTAFKFGDKSNDATEMYLADIYTVFANLAGIPGISLPLFRSSLGMPFGLQIMTDKMKEFGLLDLSNKMVQIAGNY
ncbi:MAG: Asp-tRNA(Asn)/Glu-tRNA(Gln) amidotransferase subunit GatA [Arachidicoccus sp.]|nr:Asp-tRNA(Asn)/Glu-tRNA(Gln) amidotransferase subunit GatA [Arachidicoccus sp.]